ncbi:hypothetical protein H0H93_002266 [Arthromyces matolae]|nr:hypothetical protein H0H93_002266 [Arthromyces matolae]
MASATKASKSQKQKQKAVAPPKATTPSSSKAPKRVAPPPKQKEVVEEDEDENDEDEDEEGDEEGSEEEDSDDEGVDEEGMERLMKALGDDGLNDFDRAQLDLAAGDEDEDDSEADEDEDGALDEEDEAALERIRETIKLDPSLPWTETLSVTYPQTIDVDVDDDLNRELAFYKQALHTAEAARSLAAKAKFPFTRPSDYFAEMVKSDSHMERIRQRLLDESATIKKSEDKRKEREGKKFGKQVQLEKLKEREKSKKDMEERLKGLKRSNSLSSFFLPTSNIRPLFFQNVKMSSTIKETTTTLTLRLKTPSLTDQPKEVGQKDLEVEEEVEEEVVREVWIARLETPNSDLEALEGDQNKIRESLRMNSLLLREEGVVLEVEEVEEEEEAVDEVEVLNVLERIGVLRRAAGRSLELVDDGSNREVDKLDLSLAPDITVGSQFVHIDHRTLWWFDPVLEEDLRSIPIHV